MITSQRWASIVILAGVLGMACSTLGVAAAAQPAAGQVRFDLETLRLAVEDLISIFSNRYVGGKAFLSELEEIKGLTRSESADQAALAERLLALQRRALLANPLVSGREIVYVARPQYAAAYHAIDTLFQVGEATAGRFTPGGALKALNAATGETRWILPPAKKTGSAGTSIAGEFRLSSQTGRLSAKVASYTKKRPCRGQTPWRV